MTYKLTEIFHQRFTHYPVDRITERDVNLNINYNDKYNYYQIRTSLLQRRFNDKKTE